jgi:hypothetical protein
MHVGIVACSPPGAALCFELLADGMRSLAQVSTTPTEISMHSHGLSTYMAAIDGGHWDSEDGSIHRRLGPLMLEDTIALRFTSVIGTAKCLVYIAGQRDNPFLTWQKF